MCSSKAFLLFLVSFTSFSHAMDDEVEKLGAKLKKTHITPPSSPEQRKKSSKIPHTDPKQKKYTFDVELRRYNKKVRCGQIRR